MSLGRIGEGALLKMPILGGGGHILTQTVPARRSGEGALWRVLWGGGHINLSQISCSKDRPSLILGGFSLKRTNLGLMLLLQTRNVPSLSLKKKKKKNPARFSR